MLEFEKLLTLSTAHINQHTADKLNRDPDDNCLGLCVYNKADYGWFIMGIQDIDTSQTYSEDGPLPEDLITVIDFAKDMGANILSLDCDGQEVSYLPKYDW